MSSIPFWRLRLAAALAALAPLPLAGLAGCAHHSPKDEPRPAASQSAALGPSALPVAPARAGTISYRFSPGESAITFAAFDVAGKHEGAFGAFSGSIVVSNGDPKRTVVNVDIDMASLNAADPKLVAALKSPAFLDVAKYPKAHFESTSVTDGGELGATNTVAGTLDLHGVKKSIDVPATVHVRPDGVDADAEITVHRKDFGLTFPGKRNGLVKDEIVLQVVVVATPTSAPQ